MKPKTPVRRTHPLKFAGIPALILITATAHATEIVKAATGTDLSVGSS